MDLLTKHNGHVVYIRSVTSPVTYEAACECGYRSPRYLQEADAREDGNIHAETSPAWKQPEPRRKAARKTSRKK